MFSWSIVSGNEKLKNAGANIVIMIWKFEMKTENLLVYRSYAFFIKIWRSEMKITNQNQTEVR